jgi:hypothetical protein
MRSIGVLVRRYSEATLDPFRDHFTLLGGVHTGAALRPAANHQSTVAHFETYCQPNGETRIDNRPSWTSPSDQACRAGVRLALKLPTSQSSGFGAPSWIRTSGLQLRRLTLYPSELWAPAQTRVSVPHPIPSLTSSPRPRDRTTPAAPRGTRCSDRCFRAIAGDCASPSRPSAWQRSPECLFSLRRRRTVRGDW